MAKNYKGLFEKVVAKIVTECEKTRGILGKIKIILMTFSESYSKVQLFTVFAQVLANKAPENPGFYSELAEILGNFITYEAELYDVRAKLADLDSEEGKALFSVLYPAMYHLYIEEIITQKNHYDNTKIGAIVHPVQSCCAICPRNMS